MAERGFMRPCEEEDMIPCSALLAGYQRVRATMKAVCFDFILKPVFDLSAGCVFRGDSVATLEDALF
ncbi:hypothetical protein predicted by Glimmer/Critica [Acetobacter senegalensis]|uniref:Uncharacterized protein n=1 Tax=Acetobacter senegalensis TaxID=446692 RepID=A0A0U5BCJ8_9PROT|nr:hypothetical protein predicted by Glimmer/Critica [Acetobacter senegalensis]